MKKRVVTFSKVFPSTHPRKGENTHFIEGILTCFGIDYTSHDYFVELIKMNPGIDGDFLVKFWRGLKKGIDAKFHTIRANKVPFNAGEYISAHVWAGKPYNKTEQGYWKIKFAPDFKVLSVKDVQIEIDEPYHVYVLVPKEKANEFFMLSTGEVAKNDGLSYEDFKQWFKPYLKKREDIFKGQIISWSHKINY